MRKHLKNTFKEVESLDIGVGLSRLSNKWNYTKNARTVPLDFPVFSVTMGVNRYCMPCSVHTPALERAHCIASFPRTKVKTNTTQSHAHTTCTSPLCWRFYEHQVHACTTQVTQPRCIVLAAATTSRWRYPDSPTTALTFVGHLAQLVQHTHTYASEFLLRHHFAVIIVVMTGTRRKSRIGSCCGKAITSDFGNCGWLAELLHSLPCGLSLEGELPG